MKRVIAVMLTVFMVFSICSCGNNTADVDEYTEVVKADGYCDIDTTGRVKIMCTGDSLTAGYKSTNAYRNYLANQLIENGYGDTTCFVGPGDKPTDLCPEGFRRLYGYGGNTIEGLRGGLAEAMASEPDIIILMIGTNDLGALSTHYINEEVEEIYRKLIREILAIDPDVHLFLGNPLPTTDGGRSGVIEDARNVWIRGFIKELCEDKAYNDYNVSFVDFSTNAIDWSAKEDWKPGETDHVHPSASGNIKMANRWYEAIQPTIDAILAEQAA